MLITVTAWYFDITVQTPFPSAAQPVLRSNVNYGFLEAAGLRLTWAFGLPLTAAGALRFTVPLPLLMEAKAFWWLSGAAAGFFRILGVESRDEDDVSKPGVRG